MTYAYTWMVGPTTYVGPTRNPVISPTWPNYSRGSHSLALSLVRRGHNV